MPQNTDKSTLAKDSSVPLKHHCPSHLRSTILIKDVPKGTHPQMCSVQTYIQETHTCRLHASVQWHCRSKRTSKYGKNTCDVYTCLMDRVALICSKHILTPSVIYFGTDAWQHGIYSLIRKVFLVAQINIHGHQAICTVVQVNSIC